MEQLVGFLVFVCDLKLSHSPPIATVPLGTGNNLPFAFGWGKKNPGTDRNSVLSFLKQVMEAKEMKIDKLVNLPSLSLNSHLLCVCVLFIYSNMSVVLLLY